MSAENNKIKKKNTLKIVIALLCLCIVVGVVFIIKQFGILYIKNNIKKENDLQVLQDTLNNNEIIIKKLQNDNITLQNTTMSLGDRIESLQTELNSLKNYIYKLEQQNPVNSEKNLQIMILLNKIQKLYYSNKDFIEELGHLRVLTKNKPNLTELVNKLEQYKISKNDIKNITEVFRSEYRTNLLVIKNEEKTNIFKEILANNIKIRKINVEVDDVDDKSVLIKQVEDAIITGNFVGVDDLLKNTEYCNNIFKGTCEIVEKIVMFDGIMSEFINGVVVE